MDNLTWDLDLKTGPTAENLVIQLGKLIAIHNYYRVKTLLIADYQPGIRFREKES